MLCQSFKVLKTIYRMLQDSRVVCELYLLGQDLDYWLKEGVLGLQGGMWTLSFRSRPGLRVEGLQGDMWTFIF